jgi:hypothetical protein
MFVRLLTNRITVTIKTDIELINKMIMKNFKLLSALFIVILLIVSIFNSNAQELGKNIEQYEGRLGAAVIRVNILRIGDKANEEVLIKVTGADDPINGHIYKYKKEWQNSEKRFNLYKYVTTEIPGRERFSTLHSVNSYGSQEFRIYLLDDDMKAITIYPLEYQENLDPNFMYQQYLEQLEKRKKKS